MFEKVRRLREWLKQLLNPMVSKAIDGVSHLIDESYNSRANTQSEKAEKNLDKSDYYSKEAKSHIEKYDELKMRGEKAVGALSRFKEKLNADKINTVHMLSAVPIISNFQKSIDLYGYTHDLSKANRELEEIVKRIEAIEKKQDLLNTSVEAISKSPHKWIFVNNKETNTIDLICPELLE